MECHRSVDILSEYTPRYDETHGMGMLYFDRRKSRKVAGRVDA